jgi:hypothetical protein
MGFDYYDDWISFASRVPAPPVLSYTNGDADIRDLAIPIDLPTHPRDPFLKRTLSSGSILSCWKVYLDCVAYLRLLQTAAALHRFHLDRGKLPDRLDELVPDFLEFVPADPFSSGQPLKYQLRKGRVLL